MIDAKLPLDKFCMKIIFIGLHVYALVLHLSTWMVTSLFHEIHCRSDHIYKCHHQNYIS